MRIFALLIIALLAVAPSAAAQDGGERRARALRESGQRALAEGRLEDAFSEFRDAAELSSDAAAWLDVAETADRLRLDEAALDAYRRYLESASDAANRAEIEARVRVLHERARGARYELAGDGRTVRRIEPRLDGQLVDWNGEPRPRRPPELLGLAEWEASLEAANERVDRSELMPFPAAPPGLGRLLSAP